MPALDKMAVFVSAAFFLLMGIVTLVRPELVLTNLGLERGSISARNEVRGVYGGFGIGIGFLLLWTPLSLAHRRGVLLSVASALLGMAGGRTASILIDGMPNSRRLVFLAIELILGAALLLSAREASLPSPRKSRVEGSNDVEPG